MSDSVSALLAGGQSSPQTQDMNRIRKKGKKYVVDGMQGEFNSYEDASKALATNDPIYGQGPTMTSGESAMDWGDEQSMPGAKAPNSSETPAMPEKPQWVLDSEKKLGATYDWDPMKKKWVPKADRSGGKFAQGAKA